MAAPGSFFLEEHIMERSRRWEIGVCERGTVHVHYGTGSLHILKEDFLELASAMQELADQLEVVVSTNGIQNKKGLMQ